MGNGFKKPVPAAQIKDQRLAEKVAAEKPPELTGNLEADLRLLRTLLHDSSDLVVRRFRYLFRKTWSWLFSILMG